MARKRHNPHVEIPGWLLLGGGALGLYLLFGNQAISVGTAPGAVPGTGASSIASTLRGIVGGFSGPAAGGPPVVGQITGSSMPIAPNGACPAGYYVAWGAVGALGQQSSPYCRLMGT